MEEGKVEEDSKVGHGVNKAEGQEVPAVVIRLKPTRVSLSKFLSLMQTRTTSSAKLKFQSTCTLLSSWPTRTKAAD